MILPQTDKEGNPYLSYSQIQKWNESQRDYIRRYFFGEPVVDIGYMAFGTLIGEALEKEDFSEFSIEEQAFLKTIPRLDIFEQEIKVDFDGFYVKGYIDTANKGFTVIADYKTILTEQKLRDKYLDKNYLQLILYAMGVKQMTGKLPDKLEIIGIERLGNAFRGEELVLGENYWVLNIPLTQERIDYTIDYVNRTALEISECYKVYKKISEIV